jgi:type IV secretion system protein TrbE
MTPILVIFIAAMSALVLLLVLVVFACIRRLDAEAKLKKHRSGRQGVADLLNYAAVVDDGVIVGKNGSFMSAWIYQGDDIASSTDEQRELVSMRINQALARLGNGWMIHVDAVRKYATNYSAASVSHFTDPVSEAIDEERRRLFQSLGAMYEGYFVITVTYFPPLIAQRKFTELMFDDDMDRGSREARTLGVIEQFKRECDTFESRLSTVIRMTRLRGHVMVTEEGAQITQDDFLRWLQFCITGVDHPIQLPSNPIYLDAILGGKELWTGVVPKIGRHFIQVVGIEGFPMESYPGMLGALAELSCEYRWSNRFIFMDTHEALNDLRKFRKKWRQKVRGFFDQFFNTNSGAVNHDALLMVHDAEAAMAEVNSGLVAQGYYTSVVVLMHEDRTQLETAVRQVEKAINARGFAARVESINTMDAFLGSLPGHGVENVRRPLINTLNLADLLPSSTIWTGSDTAPCPMYPPQAPALMHCMTQGATPFRLNLHVSDVGHTFIFGPTGAGKSTHLGLIAAQLRRYQGMSLYCFDKGLSMYPLVKACGGLHFDVAGDGDTLAFCPLQFLETKGDRAWAMEWIDTILALNGVSTTPAQRNEIGNAIINLHASGSKTLSEFVLTIQDESIREALKPYTADGAMGYLLDASDDGLALSNFTVFEVEDLLNLGDKYVLPVLLYLFRRIEKSLKGQPAAIILDEAWLMLGHPVFRAKIREWLKVLRKANCLVLMATQSLSDAANSGILDVIVESTATKIFLPNSFARDDDASALYRRMGLNKRQIEILATAVPKRHYYYVSDKGRRLYDLALGPLALAFVGSTDKESIATIKTLEAKYGSRWVNEWLESRGLRLEDYGVTTA